MPFKCTPIIPYNSLIYVAVRKPALRSHTHGQDVGPPILHPVLSWLSHTYGVPWDDAVSGLGTRCDTDGVTPGSAKPVLTTAISTRRSPPALGNSHGSSQTDSFFLSKVSVIS